MPPGANVNARAWVLSASLLLGCLPAAEPYRCDLAGGDRACDSVPGARCVSGYCAESVSISLCASGLRYTATARRPGECAAVEDAATADVVDAPAFDATDAAGDVRAALDAPEVAPSFDRPTSMDLGTVDVPALADVADAGEVTDVVMPPIRDVPAVTDVPAVMDVPDVPSGSPPVEWLSPLPNERSLSRRIRVRIARSVTQQVAVRVALGLSCNGEQAVTPLTGTGVDVFAGRGYHCLRLEVGRDGGVWTSPWRHIVSMGRTYDSNATAHWGRWPDFNNDGFADLLMATATAVRVFHFQNGVPIHSDATVLGPTRSALPVAVAAVGDVDGDSFGDAVISWNTNPGREVYIHRGGPMGLQGPSVRLVAPDGGLNTDLSLGEHIFALGDRNEDGRADFGVWAESRNRVRTFGMNTQGQLVERSEYRGNAPIDVFVSDADVDGDGVSDSVFTSGGVTYLSLSLQTNNIIVPVEPDNPNGFGRVLALGSDLDNDGRSELAVLAPGTSQAVIYRWANNALGVVARVDLPTVDPVALVMPGDSSDDVADDLWAFTSTNRVRLRRGGFTQDVDDGLPWRDSLGVILAGAGGDDTRGRVWGGGRRDLTPNSFVVYGYNGTRLTSQTVNDTAAGPVIAVSP